MTNPQIESAWNPNAKPSNPAARLAWALSGYDALERLIARNDFERAFSLLEGTLWEGSRFSATASWGVPPGREIDLIEKMLDSAAQYKRLRDDEPDSEGPLSNIARGSLLTQRAVLLSQEPIPREADILLAFNLAVELLKENDVRAALTWRQMAIFYEKMHQAGQAGALGNAIAAAEKSIECADRGKGAPDPVRGDDHKWHQYGARCTLAQLRLLELGNITEASDQELRSILKLFEEAEEKFFSHYQRQPCGRPAYEHSRALLSLATKVGADEATKIYEQVAERERAALRVAETIYGNAPRPFDLGVHNFALAIALHGQGKTDEAIQVAHVASTRLQTVAPELAAEVSTFISEHTIQ